MSETEKKEDPKVTLANEIMNEEELTGKPTMNKIVEIIDNVGFDKKLIKEEYFSYKKKEDHANEFMRSFTPPIKGKARRIKIMKIIETVGFDMQKVRVAYLRSTINDRIEHD